MGKPYLSPISPHLFLESEHLFAIYESIAALSSFLLAKHFNVGFGVGVPVFGLLVGGTRGDIGLLVIGRDVCLPVTGVKVVPSSDFSLSSPVVGCRKNRQVRTS